MGQQILVPLDGDGPQQRRALEQAIRMARLDDAPLFLLNVQIPVSGQVAAYFGGAELERLQQEAGVEALAGAAARVQAAGLRHRLVVRVGRRAETIARTAQELGCSRIVFGEPQPGLGSRVFGSMAQQVAHLLGATAGYSIL